MPINFIGERENKTTKIIEDWADTMSRKNSGRPTN
jgi:hypothetical protein